MRNPKNQFDSSVASPELWAEVDAITRRYDPDQAANS